MFRKNLQIGFENKLATLLLKESVTNPLIKQTLAKMGALLKTEILLPLLQATEKNQFSDIPIEFQHAITNLAKLHSNTRQQYGALLRHKYPDYLSILSDMANVRELLTLIDDALTVKNQWQEDDIIKLLACISHLSLSYVEHLPSLRKNEQEFKKIYNLIWPSPCEIAVRVSREELGQGFQVTSKLGLRALEKDLTLRTPSIAASTTHYDAGKSFFGAISMEERLKMVLREFEKLRCQLQTSDTTEQSNIQQTYQHFLKNLTETLGKTFTDKLVNGEINKANLATIAQSFTPSAIKLATRESQLLIASLSGTAARVLITLHHLGGFYNSKGFFSFKKANIVSNCIMGLFIQAGHHSREEVAEIFNRLIDYIALFEQAKISSFYLTPIEKGKFFESNLSYSRGSAQSFIHNQFYKKNYAIKNLLTEEIIKKNPSLLSSQI